MASTQYKRVTHKKQPVFTAPPSAAERRWQKFKTCSTLKESGAIPCIAISPVAPYDVAVCCGARVSIYAQNGLESKRSISKTKEAVSCAVFRSDGKLLAVGDASGLVQVHDLASRSIIRSYRFHTASVRSLVFCPGRLSLFASAGDDRTIQVFDLSSETPLLSIAEAHSDYIRSLAWAPGNAEALLSAGYDHHVKLWEIRSKPALEPLQPLLDVNVGLPIEHVFFYSSCLALVAAGSRVQVLNVLGAPTAEALPSIETGHQKTITSLARYGSSILAAGLDGGLKALSLDAQTGVWACLPALAFPGPVLTLAASTSTIVAGLSNGLVIFKTNSKAKKSASTEKDFSAKEKPRPWMLDQQGQNNNHNDNEDGDGHTVFRPNTFRYFMRGSSLPVSNAISVPASASIAGRLKPYDRHLKKFQYAKALEAAAQEDITALLPLLLELIHRSGLKAALASPAHFSESLVHSLGSFVIKNLSSPAAFPVLERTVSQLLDSLSFSALEHSPALSEFFIRLRSRISAELALQRDMSSVLGTLGLILSNSASLHSHQ